MKDAIIAMVYKGTGFKGRSLETSDSECQARGPIPIDYFLFADLLFKFFIR